MSSEISFQVSAPGKVILFGEHSVVYGKTALAATLGQRTLLRFTTQGSKDVRIHLPMIKVDQTFPLEELKTFVSSPDSDSSDFATLVRKANEFLTLEGTTSDGQRFALIAFLSLLRGMFASARVEVGPFTIEVTSELAIGAGTGSSASYGVCLAAAVFQYLRCRCKEDGVESYVSKQGGQPVDILAADLTVFSDDEVELILRWALLSDGIMHGNPSGIDASVITRGGMIEFRRGEGLLRLTRAPPMRMLLVNTRVSRDTKQLVARVADLAKRLPEVVTSIMVAMDHVALAAKHVLEKMDEQREHGAGDAGHVAKLGELMTVNHGLLYSLAVSHTSLDDICRIASRHKMAAKLTGAGGGGYALVLVPEHAGVDALTAELEGAGYHAVMADMGGPGVQLSHG